jgi:hypothetical protein
MLFSAGDCPVCFFSGDVLFVKDRLSGQIFWYCPSCGCAWPRPPGPTIDSVEEAEAYAPGGIELPTRHDIVASDLESLIVREVALERWSISLEPYLQNPEGPGQS